MDWSDMKMARQGDVFRTKIKTVVRGTLGQFKGEDYFKNLKKGTPEEVKACPAVQITTEDGTVTEFALPKDGLVQPKTDFGRYLARYGKGPLVGDEVDVTVNQRGYKTIFLPPK